MKFADKDMLCHNYQGSVKEWILFYLPVLDYFLEDCIQMLNFTPPPSDKKKKKGGGGEDDEDAVEVDVSNCTTSS